MTSYSPLGWMPAPKPGWPRYATAGGVTALVLLALHSGISFMGSGSAAPLVGYDSNTSQRIQDDLHLTSEQCQQVFPRLYSEADRAAKYWRRKGGVTLEEVDAAEEDGSNARIAIIDNRLYIKSANNNAPHSRTRASLAAIQQAILTSTEPLPDLDLVIMSADGGGGVGPRFVLDRKAADEHMWLLPDFGFYAWPEPLGSGSGAYHQVRRNTLEREWELSSSAEEKGAARAATNATEPSSWSVKIPKLLWRGVPMVEVRQDLLRAAGNQPWGDVHDLDWGHVGEDSPYKTPAEHCDYQFLAHVEGWAYSGRLKYLQNCRSVIVTHPLEWIQHYHHLFDASSSSSQNIVVVPTPLTEHLPRVMEHLLADPERAERIASESWRVFREGYLSPAATECYLRYVLRAYAAVQTFKPSITSETAAYEGFVLTGDAHWGRH